MFDPGAENIHIFGLRQLFSFAHLWHPLYNGTAKENATDLSGNFSMWSEISFTREIQMFASSAFSFSTCRSCSVNAARPFRLFRCVQIYVGMMYKSRFWYLSG